MIRSPQSRIQQEVLGFDVAVNDIVGMKNL
jgi:hypothetical protein